MKGVILMTKYKKGDIVTGIVTGIEDYGVFIELEEQFSGLIHISEISKSFVKNINDYVTIGEKIKVEILEVNEEKLHTKLSIKDINYSFKNRRRTKINETSTGFSTLKLKLPIWINQKEKEILQKNKKN